MNLLEVHVIFIHNISDQQLSRILLSNTFTQDHIATLKFKTVDTPFNSKGKILLLTVILMYCTLISPVYLTPI